MKKHFRMFVLGFCATARTVTEEEQGNLERALGAIVGIVPAVGQFVSFQFSPEGTETAATLESVPKPTDPVNR